jgi:chromosome segregation ATPase
MFNGRTIEKGDKILDVRDVTRLFSDMENDRAGLEDDLQTAKDDLQTIKDDPDSTEEQIDEATEAVKDAETALSDWDIDNGEEFEELKAFYDDIPAEGTLIHDDYFQTYAQQVAEDIGAIDPKAQWPLNHIDWDAAADALRQDYTVYEWGDETYLSCD